MSSLSLWESVAAYQVISERGSEAEVVAPGEEFPLALFLGANYSAFLFTTQRFIFLKQTQPLARAMAGHRIINFTGRAADFTLAEILSQAKIKTEFPITAVDYIDAGRIYRAGAVKVYTGGRKYELTVGQKQAEIAPQVEMVREQLGIPKSAAGVVMNRELRSWTLFSLLTGATSLMLSFVFPGMLDPIWGLILVMVSAGILCFAEPAMFIILGVVMVWAALMNLLGFSSSPLRNDYFQIAPLFQLYWAKVLFTKYQKYEHLYESGSANLVAGAAGGGLWRRRRGRVLCQLAFLLPRLGRFSASLAEWAPMSVLSLVIAGIEVLLLLSLCEALLLQLPQQVIGLISHGHMHLAIIGVAVGIAALCSRRSSRWAALLGVAINTLMAVTIISLLMTGVVGR